MQKISREQAIMLAKSNAYDRMTDEQIARAQFEQERLFGPISRFHQAAEKITGGSIFTHEFGTNWNGLKQKVQSLTDPVPYQFLRSLVPDPEAFDRAADGVVSESVLADRIITEIFSR